MNFVTNEYLIFIIAVFLIYWHLPRKWQNLFLLGASYFFYAHWDYRFLSLIIISTIVDYISGPRIHRSENPRVKKAWLVVSLIANLGILGYFKYFNFFADSFAALAQTIGLPVSHTTLNIILPVGISFYTFQTLSYSIDIYRGKLKPTDSFIDFAAFVAFFPQLVAGPIVRAREFIFQLEQKRTFSGENLQNGLVRFLYGFFKKAFIADTLAIYLCDPVFANPGDYSTGTLWLALLGYTIQIYADFSGYSNMAIGSAQILGFDIPENFNFPYIARNMSEFWRRWHMTMSRFFRDYIYIGLGGNRHGFAKTLRNLSATVVVSGLWHGAGWTFVAWGLLHGIYISSNQIVRRFREKKDGEATVLGSIAGWILTLAAVMYSWVLFRAQSFEIAFTYTKGLFTNLGSAVVQVDSLVWIAIAAALVDHVYGLVRERRPEIDHYVPAFVRAIAYAAMIVFIYHARPADVNPFIYFQF